MSSVDYYPFGLTFNSYQRENKTPNLYQYNGKELQEAIFQLLKNSGIGFYEAYNGDNPEFKKVKSQQK